MPRDEPLAFHNPSPYSRAFVREFYFSRGQSAWGLLEFDTQRRASVSFEAPYYDSSIFTAPSDTYTEIPGTAVQQRALVPYIIERIFSLLVPIYY